MEWALWLLLGDHWLGINQFYFPSIVVSRLTTVLMDLTLSADFTKLIIGSFFHSYLYSWDNLNAQLSNYSFFEGDMWIGGFVSTFIVLQDTFECSLYIFIINGVRFSSLEPFLNWVFSNSLQIVEPLLSYVVNIFIAMWEIYLHSIVDPHGFQSSFPLLDDVTSS